MMLLDKKFTGIIGSVIEALPYGVILIDLEGNVLGINRNISFMLNISETAPCQKHYTDILDESLKVIFEELIRETKKLGAVLERQVEIFLFGTVSIFVGISGSVLKDGEGSPFGIIITCREMTATQELERMRELDKLKSDFISMVSHDLKSPLTSICGYADVLLQFSGEEFNNEETEYLQIIKKEGLRLTKMINNMLNVAAIESGTIHLNLEETALKDIILEVIKISAVDEGKYDFSVTLAPEIPILRLDKEQMVRVFLNLVNNAVKYSPNGGSIKVEGYIKEKNVCVDVSDNGIGMSQETLSHLFEKFFRANSEEVKEIKGTGLGLVIIKGIVEAHGGCIVVKSQAGEGSTFSVILPYRLSTHKSES